MPPTPKPLRWLRANFHAHAARRPVDDDGTEPPAALHRALRDAGLRLLGALAALDGEHRRPTPPRSFRAQRAAEAELDVPGLTIAAR